MGKRKAKSKPPPKRAKAILPSNFNCLFCNHENAVSVKLDRKSQTGELWCKVCGQSFQTTVNALSEPVDVYSDWVDACDSVAKEAARQSRLPDEDNEDFNYRDREPSHTKVTDPDEDDDLDADFQ